MRIQFIGSGDAFGSGGRFNTCIHITGSNINFLLDCGASSVVALKANHVAQQDIGLILVTHFHADHFGGIPFFILNGQFSKRTGPLTIAGPRGLADWFVRSMETAFPGSSKTKQRFDVALSELEPRSAHRFGDVTVTPFLAEHGSPGGPCHAYRIEAEGRTIAYTGDTEWTEELIDACRDADLLIAEAYFFDKQVRMHLDLATLSKRLHEINAKRVIVTHMGEDMLSRAAEAACETAEDGMILEI